MNLWVPSVISFLISGSSPTKLSLSLFLPKGKSDISENMTDLIIGSGTLILFFFNQMSKLNNFYLKRKGELRMFKSRNRNDLQSPFSVGCALRPRPKGHFSEKRVRYNETEKVVDHRPTVTERVPPLTPPCCSTYD